MTQAQLEAHREYVTDIAIDEIDIRGIQSSEDWDIWCSMHAEQLEEDADEFVSDDEFVKILSSNVKFENNVQVYFPQGIDR